MPQAHRKRKQAERELTDLDQYMPAASQGTQAFDDPDMLTYLSAHVSMAMIEVIAKGDEHKAQTLRQKASDLLTNDPVLLMAIIRGVLFYGYAMGMRDHKNTAEVIS